MSEQRIRHPGVLVVAGFAALILVGTELLSLSIAHENRQPVSWSDAFFTAVSAVTVTGLGVVDTAPTWSRFGEFVILVLIQIGGLGIMTLAGFLGIIFTRRLGLRTGMRVGAEIGFTDLGTVRNLLQKLVVFVALSEIVFAVLLSASFVLVEGEGLVHGTYLGVFHSISAFNNAGFSILDGGLERYADDWFISLVVAFAFIVGGIGFPVVFELYERWRSPQRWSLHTKVTLAMTFTLLTFGTAMLAVVEWSNDATLGSLSPPDKMLAAFFQSATARTAGFNTVPIGELRPASLLVFILLMVVGASSASTGGGIKTSTFAVVIRSTLAEFRGDRQATLFNRRVPRSVERQALSLVVAALGGVGTAAFTLAYLEPDLPALELLFETASAFGTVGVSTGLTTELGGPARLVIIGLMFLGRVGPITFGTAILLRAQPKRYGFAEEALIVG